MKKQLFKMFFSALVLGAVSVMMSSCSSEETYYNSYSYKVYRDAAIAVNSEEMSSLESELVRAVGQNSTNLLHDPVDGEMTSKCEAIINKYKQNAKSIYLKYRLVRLTYDASTPGRGTESDVASFELGVGINTPYVTYFMNSNEEEPYKALEAKKASLSDSIYRECQKTLYALLGKHSSNVTVKDGFVSWSSTTYSSAFETVFAKNKVNKTCYQDGQYYTKYITSMCDSIADSYATSPLPVKVVLSLGKMNVVTKEQSTIWTRTMEPNM